MPLCATAQPLYTGIANIFGAAVSGTTMGPDPNGRVSLPEFRELAALLEQVESGDTRLSLPGIRH